MAADSELRTVVSGLRRPAALTAVVLGAFFLAGCKGYRR